jgi:hypothetical protein
MPGDGTVPVFGWDAEDGAVGLLFVRARCN